MNAYDAETRRVLVMLQAWVIDRVDADCRATGTDRRTWMKRAVAEKLNRSDARAGAETKDHRHE
ncbi:hypothetical protein [Mesorhizobium sp. M1272]|uniref:hypothetical protein n=1 Tax=Mesorhizobium sp. M1272 TaxID=2957074 RepID=UPI00333E0231